jgi:hypothetical protein
MFIENKWSELQIMPRYVNPAVGGFLKKNRPLRTGFPHP